jgi:hypothetical protein
MAKKNAVLQMMTVFAYVAYIYVRSLFNKQGSLRLTN